MATESRTHAIDVSDRHFFPRRIISVDARVIFQNIYKDELVICPVDALLLFSTVSSHTRAFSFKCGIILVNLYVTATS